MMTTETVTFVQIAAATTYGAAGTLISLLYGLGADGRVYRCVGEEMGWIRLTDRVLT